MRDENQIHDQSAEQGVLSILLNSELAVNRLKDLKAWMFGGDFKHECYSDVYEISY